MIFGKKQQVEITEEEKELLSSLESDISNYKQDLISVSARKHWIVQKYIRGLVYYGMGCALFVLCCIIGGGIYYWMKPTPLVFFEYADGSVKCAYDLDKYGQNKLSGEQKDICRLLENYNEGNYAK